MDKKFDTKVQLLKYKVLKEVASLAWEDKLLENVIDIPSVIAPGKIPTMRCCVYKERAILEQRVKLAIGGNRYNKKVIQVIDIACEDCPAGGYEVTSACRGCLAHRCEEVCRQGALTFGTDQKAHIDKTKCVECGMCAKVCPYNAINNFKRPCESSCKVNAISMGENKEAVINYDKCISCGSCVYTCPFGAITDRSYILDVISLLKHSGASGNKVYALVAPAIASQFSTGKLGKIVTAIKKLGFDDVIEVALGADVVAKYETKELVEKGVLTSSCCPAFVSYVEKNFPMLKDKISSNLSPTGTIARILKQRDNDVKVVFIGPCTAKKVEFQRPEYEGLIDSVITFEEMQALIDSKNIDVDTLESSELSGATKYGRGFAVSGGLANAVCEYAKNSEEFSVSPIVCNGIDECRNALLRLSKGVLPNNFIEGMACQGGCVGGAGNLTHIYRNEKSFGEYVSASKDKTVDDVVNTIEDTKS